MLRATCMADDGPSSLHPEIHLKGPLLAPLAAAIALSACTSMPVDEEWEATPSHPALPATFLVVDSKGIEQNCGSPAGLYVYGCANRDYKRRDCLVYTRASPPGWLVEHEKKHCDGWDHAVVAGEFPERALARARGATRQNATPWLAWH